MPRLVAEKDNVIPQIAELFRENGYQGTSLSLITDRTGLGKGSLYHFFPRGKPEMAEAVLESVNDWFEANIFAPLLTSEFPRQAIADMFSSVTDYFRSGRRVCLVGAMALDSSRDPFAEKISAYFRRWVSALSSALVGTGLSAEDAKRISHEIVVGIQGAIVLSRAIDDNSVFLETISALRTRFSLPQ